MIDALTCPLELVEPARIFNGLLAERGLSDAPETTLAYGESLFHLSDMVPAREPGKHEEPAPQKSLLGLVDPELGRLTTCVVYEPTRTLPTIPKGQAA